VRKMRIDQEVSQAYGAALKGWVNSTKGRKRSERYGRNFLIVADDFMLPNQLLDSLTTKDKLIVLEGKVIIAKNLAALGLRKKLDYVTFSPESSFTGEVLPTCDSLDQVEREARKMSLLLREGGSLVTLLPPSSLGFINLALRNVSFRRNSLTTAELPQGFKAIRVIK